MPFKNPDTLGLKPGDLTVKKREHIWIIIYNTQGYSLVAFPQVICLGKRCVSEEGHKVIRGCLEKKREKEKTKRANLVN